jgi:hypothetical protein
MLRMLRFQLPDDRLHRLASRARVAAISREPLHRKEPFVRSRLAVLLVLVLGFAFSGTGAGLAISGLTGDDATTAEGQYGSPNTTPLGANEVAGAKERAPAGEQHVAPAAQVPRQVAAGTGQGGSLPFTGFAAIPVLLLGVGLLTGGFVMRRGSRPSTS